MNRFLTADLSDSPSVKGRMNTNAHGHAISIKETILLNASEVPYRFDIAKNPARDVNATNDVNTVEYLSLNPSKLIFCS